MALSKYLRALGHGSAVVFAASVEATPGMVSGWASGKKKPSAKYRIRIRRKTKPKIDLEWWDQPAVEELEAA